MSTAVMAAAATAFTLLYRPIRTAPVESRTSHNATCQSSGSGA